MAPSLVPLLQRAQSHHSAVACRRLLLSQVPVDCQGFLVPFLVLLVAEEGEASDTCCRSHSGKGLAAQGKWEASILSPLPLVLLLLLLLSLFIISYFFFNSSSSPFSSSSFYISSSSSFFLSSNLLPLFFFLLLLLLLLTLCPFSVGFHKQAARSIFTLKVTLGSSGGGEWAGTRIDSRGPLGSCSSWSPN